MSEQELKQLTDVAECGSYKAYLQVKTEGKSMKDKTFKEKSLEWLGSTMSEEQIATASYLFKYIEQYGLEATKAEIAFERAKRNLLEAYERKLDLMQGRSGEVSQ